jgi:hypothetical protein
MNTTQTTHTPGPWTAVADMVIQRGNAIDREVCRCSTGLPELDDANARLIAAAPELLAALVAMVSHVEGAYDGDTTYMDETIPESHPWRTARAAVHKATGGAR